MRRLTDLQAHLLQGRQMTSLLARGESDKLGFLPYRTETTIWRRSNFQPKKFFQPILLQ